MMKQEVPSSAFEDAACSARFPTAVISACCDLATLLEHPFTSLTQFVEFVKELLADESKTTDEAHEIIFHRYCLAYANKDQLLFQVDRILATRVNKCISGIRVSFRPWWQSIFKSCPGILPTLTMRTSVVCWLLTTTTATTTESTKTKKSGNLKNRIGWTAKGSGENSGSSNLNRTGEKSRKTFRSIVIVIFLN